MRETRSSGFGASSPCFKLILARPAVLSVTTDLSVSTSRNLVVPYAPLATAILHRPCCAEPQERRWLPRSIRSTIPLARSQRQASELLFMPFSLSSLSPNFRRNTACSLSEAGAIFPCRWQFWTDYPSLSRWQIILHRPLLSHNCLSSQAIPSLKCIRRTCRMTPPNVSSGVSLAFGNRQHLLHQPMLSLNRKSATRWYHRLWDRACALPRHVTSTQAIPTHRAAVNHMVAIFLSIVASELGPQLIFVSFLVGMQVCRLTAAIWFTHSTHCHHMLRNGLNHFSACLL